MYYKFKATATIANYFPQLLKTEWWLASKCEGGVQLIDHDGTLNEALKSLVISDMDIEAQKEKL